MSYCEIFNKGTRTEYKLYYKLSPNGTLIKHREDGPAIEFITGTKQWWINDKLHREDGPAIIYSDEDFDEYFCEDKEIYLLNDIEYSKEKYLAIIRFGGFV